MNPLGGGEHKGYHRDKFWDQFFFLIYINDLPKLASIGTKILLYADDTSIIVTNPNLKNFETQIDKIFRDINNWFKIKQLV